MDTFKKVAGYTLEDLVNIEIINGFQLINKTNNGFEIIDRRDLKSRLLKPVKGKGVKMTFGLSHFIVTESYYNTLTSLD